MVGLFKGGTFGELEVGDRFITHEGRQYQKVTETVAVVIGPGPVKTETFPPTGRITPLA